MQLNELIGELVPRSIEVLRSILNSDAASPSVQLRATLAVLKYAQAAEQPHQPKEEESARPAFQQRIVAEMEQMCTNAEKIAKLHNSAQQPIRRPAEPGRNSQCPCNSGLKYKRCCAGKIGFVCSTPAVA
jgi:uncharacterized protein YecA (UPF0149 family)